MLADAYADALQQLMHTVQQLTQAAPVHVGSTPRTLVLQHERLQLYHYQPQQPRSLHTPLLIVYALVNRPGMLDLQPDRSFIRNLLHQGIQVYLAEWLPPRAQDRYLGLDDYILDYVDTAVDAIRHRHGVRQINMAGVCQGGTFSAIYTALHPHKVKNLITLVAPVQFGHAANTLFAWAQQLDVQDWPSRVGNAPGHWLAQGFQALRPFQRIQKYVDMLAGLPSEQLSNFLRMERWIFDSPDVPGRLFEEFISLLYQQNQLARGQLVLRGLGVDLQRIRQPLLNIYAVADHLIPPAASIALPALTRSIAPTTYAFAGGHIGVFVSARTQHELGPAVAHWLYEWE